MVPISSISGSTTSMPKQNSVSAKRKRASKPKVRTGCLTCKIRRVKCGEERPACIRCTSTGRKCDGYDKVMPSRPAEADDNTRVLALVAQTSCTQPCSEIKAMRILRPLAADIDGTHTERLYFHRFRRVAEAGLCNHVTNLTSFWSRLAPRLSHTDEAVKHSIVALGSAYHIYQSGIRQNNCSSLPRDLEIFTIQQYGTAMSKLSSYAHVPMRDRITVTLLCCISFVCIEALRNNWRPALTHLSNGLRIIESLPMSTLNELRNIRPAHEWEKETEELLGMDYILRLFATWEVSCALFAENFKPFISIKLYEGRELDDTPPDEFQSITQAHRVVVQYTRDVFALVWLTREHQGDDEFWSQPIPQRQHEILTQKGNSMAGLFERFLATPQAPPAGTGGYESICLDKLHYKCARLLCYNLRQKPHQRSQCPRVVARYAELVSIASLLQHGLTTRQKETAALPRSFTLDIGIIPPLYFIIVSCGDPVVQQRALQLLQNYPQQENFWNGNSVRNLLRTAENINCGPAHLLEEVPNSLAFGKGIPALYEKLQELRIKVEED